MVRNWVDGLCEWNEKYCYYYFCVCGLVILWLMGMEDLFIFVKFFGGFCGDKIWWCVIKGVV